MLSSTTNSAFSGYCPSSNPTIPSLNNQVISYLNHINKSMRITLQYNILKKIFDSISYKKYRLFKYAFK